MKEKPAIPAERKNGVSAIDKAIKVIQALNEMGASVASGV